MSSWNGPEWVKREDGTLLVCLKKVNEWIKGPQCSKLFAPEKKKVDGTDTVVRRSIAWIPKKNTCIGSMILKLRFSSFFPIFPQLGDRQIWPG